MPAADSHQNNPNSQNRPDPVALVNALDARWSPSFDAYASGQIDVSEIECVLCQTAPCRCS